jgi:tetratricopeptide (TPR) repeat protein
MRFVLLTAVLLALPQVCLSQEPDGTYYVPFGSILTKVDAPLKTTGKEKAVIPAKTMLTVIVIKGNQVTVDWHDGKRLLRGTINKDDTLPMSKGFLFLEDELKASPTARNLEAHGLFSYSLGENDEAIKKFDKAIELEPNKAQYYLSRGLSYDAQGEFETAINDYTKCLELNPEMTRALCCRAGLLIETGKVDEALKDAETAIALDDKDPRNLQQRGWIMEKKRAFAAAIRDYEASVRVDPNFASGQNSLAWLLATCPDDKLRNGAKAVTAATKACKLTNWVSSGELDTLAAACAEKGDFKNAVKWQTKVVEFDDPDYGEDQKVRLKLYQERKPYREPAE